MMFVLVLAAGVRVPDSILNVDLPSECVKLDGSQQTTSEMFPEIDNGNADECRPLTPTEKNAADLMANPSKHHS